MSAMKSSYSFLLKTFRGQNKLRAGNLFVGIVGAAVQEQECGQSIAKYNRKHTEQKKIKRKLVTHGDNSSISKICTKFTAISQNNWNILW
jgi:hypothetical protein